MNRIFIALFALTTLGINAVSAATVELTRGNGLPGEAITLFLSIDDVPVFEDGFSLDLNLHFDASKIQYVARSAKKVGLFRDEPDASNTVPPSDFSIIDEVATPSRLSLGLVGTYTRGAPGGGNLISLDFLIASDVSNGEIPIELELVSSSNNDVSSARNGVVAISAVPVPPALLLLGAPLAWMFARVRRS